MKIYYKIKHKGATFTVSKNFIITNKAGLHMRPAQLFAEAMNKYSAAVTIKKDGRRINGKSILNLMTACLSCGTEITVECSGIDEEAMLGEAALLLENGLGDASCS